VGGGRRQLFSLQRRRKKKEECVAHPCFKHLSSIQEDPPSWGLLYTELVGAKRGAAHPLRTQQLVGLRPSKVRYSYIFRFFPWFLFLFFHGFFFVFSFLFLKNRTLVIFLIFFKRNKVQKWNKFWNETNFKSNI
jgi:hypothetical protein